jgi:hypothetical protein
MLCDPSPSDFQTNCCMHFLHGCYMSCPPLPPWFLHPNTIWQEYKIWMWPILNTVTFSFLQTKDSGQCPKQYSCFTVTHHCQKQTWHKLWSFSLRSCVQPPITNFHTSTYSLGTLVSNTLNLRSSLTMRIQVSQPYKTAGHTYCSSQHCDKNVGNIQ